MTQHIPLSRLHPTNGMCLRMSKKEHRSDPSFYELFEVGSHGCQHFMIHCGRGLLMTVTVKSHCPQHMFWPSVCHILRRKPPARIATRVTETVSEGRTLTILVQSIIDFKDRLHLTFMTVSLSKILCQILASSLLLAEQNSAASGEVKELRRDKGDITFLMLGLLHKCSSPGLKTIL